MFSCIQLTNLRCWLFTQKHTILDVWKGSEYACVQIAFDNVLCLHNKYLIRYFKFLHGSRIICLHWNISELHWLYVFEKLDKARLIASIFVNIIQYPCTRKNNIYFSNKRGTPPCFHPDTNPAIGHALVHSINKSHVLVVTVELIWFLFLNILSFNFLQTPRKSLRFTSYVNRPVVILTDHCQSYTAFCLICAVQSGHVYFFFATVCSQC